ncbi:transposase [Streptomyces anulatus]|uniref:transposase n=1 Tax=Streptomyces anulatus TaxID=1892 RepID=UPI0036AA2C2B
MGGAGSAAAGEQQPVRGRWRDHRQVINGIIHRLGTGVQWRELPERFGPWKTVRKRHLLRSADGTWERLLRHVQSAVDAAEGGIDGNINVELKQFRAVATRYDNLGYVYLGTVTAAALLIWLRS